MQPYEAGWSPPSDTLQVHAIAELGLDLDELAVVVTSVGDVEVEGAVELGSGRRVGGLE